MKKSVIIVFFLSIGFFIISLPLFGQDTFDLDLEYSKEAFQKGIRSYHNCEYEKAIIHFLEALGYKNENYVARYYLGEAYRKAGYEKSALYTWNTLLNMGYDKRELKSKISYIYKRNGMLTDIMIDKDYILREDLQGYQEENVTSLFMKPSQIAVGPNNHYYIASFITGTVLELNSNFKVVRNYISAVPELKKPFGVAIDKEGDLYVSDFANDVILKINQLNVVEKQIGFKGIGDGALLGPKYLIFDDEENLYVSDSGNRKINKYKKDGTFLFSFGNKEPGLLGNPNGLYYKNNRIYVCDTKDNRILVFDKSGNYISSFGENKVEKPFDITMDALNRFLIVCEKKVWVYEEENRLWYVIDAVGNRLKKGISIASDNEDNILVTDFNTSRLLTLSLERHRYTNLNVMVERVFARKFPTVHLSLLIERDDFSSPAEIERSNLTIYENGKNVPIIGTGYTEERDQESDIAVIYDNSRTMEKYGEDFKIIMDTWMENRGDDTLVSFVSFEKSQPVMIHDFYSTRLEIKDALEKTQFGEKTDIGNSIKFGINHMISRFSSKALIIVTAGEETGDDFERFKIEDSISYARNNDIPVYVVSFEEGALSPILRNIAERTGGDYYRVYDRSDLKDLFSRIEEKRGREIILSYKSKAVSRFNEEPVYVTVRVDYSGMTGVGSTIYYPGKR